MDKQMLRTTITQLRQIALFAVGVSLLTACGNNQSGMKLGDKICCPCCQFDNERPDNILSGDDQRNAGY